MTLKNETLVSNTETKPVTRNKLGDGINIQITQQYRVNRWHHNTTVGNGDASLNGLRRIESKPVGQLEVPASKVSQLGDITNEEAKRLSCNYYQLPNILQEQFGRTLLDQKREMFINQANKVKQALLQKSNNGKVSSSLMASADNAVNKYAFEGYDVIITGFSVTTSNPKGSKKRSDGKFVSTQILRRVIIDKPLTNDELNLLMELICGQLISIVEKSQEYIVTDKGRDRFGNSVIALRAEKGRITVNNSSSSTQRKLE